MSCRVIAAPCSAAAAFTASLLPSPPTSRFSSADFDALMQATDAARERLKQWHTTSDVHGFVSRLIEAADKVTVVR